MLQFVEIERVLIDRMISFGRKALERRRNRYVGARQDFSHSPGRVEPPRRIHPRDAARPFFSDCP
jgi:hypothetical protein